MNVADPLSRITWLHHFTDMRNLPSIRTMGGLYSRQLLKQNAGAQFYPGGNQWSLDADEMVGMDQYVHLCMRTNHAMEHIAKQEKRIEKTLWLYIDAASVFQMRIPAESDQHSWVKPITIPVDADHDSWAKAIIIPG
jgi:hypothetical protein